MTVYHDFAPHLGYCPYFAMDMASVTEEIPFKGTVDEKSFLSILCVSGAGIRKCGQDDTEVKKGDVFFLPAGTGGVFSGGMARDCFNQGLSLELFNISGGYNVLF